MAHYAQLILQQRYQIQALTQHPILQKQIAKQVGVTPATISRELARNRLNGSYLALAAQQCSGELRQRQAYRLTGSLKEGILKGLKERHSPERISGVMALEAGCKVISHEAIYQFMYSQNTADGQPLTTYLRIRHKKRYKKRGQLEKRGSIPNRVSIDRTRGLAKTSYCRSQHGGWSLGK
ncbi:helix-turn-helix domain-containing protein [Spirosoma sp. HMF3257]|uniref:Transposase IS30-like HTH domain-containing protein n=1 Tax=Spirosoma telluris TaxID=2183553 RepID=A0A327NIG2_9BACT|nr:helix-turn-helix domain-containing protein [Spirosoma telluris]RAI73806.1 hypothetical protein HMF3257_04205 [Spirosoma telluris]